MKKMTALFLCLILVMSIMPVAFAAGITPDVQLDTYKDANARTEPVPKDSTGAIQWYCKWDHNDTMFVDEPTDGTIQRTSFYTESGDHDWYLSFMYSSGLNGQFKFRPWNTTTPENAGCYIQWDFGIATTIDEIEMYYNNIRGTYDAVPVDVKFAYSDDGLVWTDVVMPAYDLTDASSLENYGYTSDTATAMTQAYAKYTAGQELTDDEKALLDDAVKYTIGSKSRYLRFYPLDNGQQAYEDRGETLIPVVYLKMYDYSMPWEGKGTEASPYLIKSLADFQLFANYVNDGNSFEGKHFRLEADIDMTGQTFQIGRKNWDNNEAVFAGIFDGNSHKVYNYTYEDWDGGAALFAVVSGSEGNNAVIKNLTVDGNVYGNKWVAGIVGYGRYADVINCTNNVNVYSDQNNNAWEFKGGVAAEIRRGSVVGCTNNGTIYVSNSKFGNGGIVGYISNATVSECINNADIEYNNTNGSSAIFGGGPGVSMGGIVGHSDGTSLIEKCVNNGDLYNNNSNWEIGALVGVTIDNTDINDCYNLGTGNCAGLVGRTYGTTKITNCFSKADSVSASDVINNAGELIITNSYVYEPNGTEGVNANGSTVITSADSFKTLASLLDNGRDVWVQGTDYPELKCFAVIEDVVTSVTIDGVTDATVTYSVTLADEDADAVVIIALYDGNDLVAVKTVNAAETSATLSTAEGADNAKIFVWENLATVKPIAIDEYSIAQ